MSQQHILKIDFSHFPIDEYSAQIPGKLFLKDNFDEGQNGRQGRRHSMSHPVQLSMSVLLVCYNGKMVIETNQKNLAISAGECAILLPGSFFKYISYSPDLKAIFIAIAPGFADYTKGVKLGVQIGERLNSNPKVTMSPFLMDEINGLYHMLKRKLYNSEFRYKEAVARNVISILGANIANEIQKELETETEEQPNNRKTEIFHQFISSVHKNYTKERSVAFYADKLCVTPKYLSSVIHEVSGKYATEWINNFVILECMALLRTNGISVKDVCNKMNFPNQSFFAKYFKQHTGKTPKEYKQNI